MENILLTMLQKSSMLRGAEASARGAGAPAAEVDARTGKLFQSLLASLAGGGKDVDGAGLDWTAAGKELVGLLSHAKEESPESSSEEGAGARPWVFSSEGQAALGEFLARIGSLISRGKHGSDSESSGIFPRILLTSEDFPFIQLRSPGDRVVPAPNNLPTPSSAPLGSLVIENSAGKIELSWWRLDGSGTGEQAFLLILTVDEGEGEPLVARMIVEKGDESALAARIAIGKGSDAQNGTVLVSDVEVETLKGADLSASEGEPRESIVPLGKQDTISPGNVLQDEAGTKESTLVEVKDVKVPQTDQQVGILKEEARTSESGVRARITTRPGAVKAVPPVTRTDIRLDEAAAAKTAEGARAFDSLSFEASGKLYRVLDVQGERKLEMLERDARADKIPLWLDRQAALERRRSRIELLPITRPELANGRFVFDLGGLEAVRARALNVPLRIAANEVYRAITEEMADMRRLSEGSRTIRLVVEPPHLGTLTARIEISGNTLNLSLTVSAQAAREFLEGELPNLKSSLQDLGFELSKFGVEVESGSAGREDVYRWSDARGKENDGHGGSEGVEAFGDEPDGRLLNNRLYI